MVAFPPNISLKDKNILITGANSGLGYHAALHALELHASMLILTVRSLKTGEDTKEKLLAEPSVSALDPKPEILVYELDLSSFDSVTSFMAKLTSDQPRLDIALLNAGVLNYEMQISKDGYEVDLQVNYIANVLLATLLLPLLERSATPGGGSPSRLTLVGSQMYARHGFDRAPVPPETPIFTYLNDPKTFSMFGRYSQTKFFVASWIRQVADADADAAKTDKPKVIVNCMCPGPAASNIARSMPWYMQPLAKLVNALVFPAAGAVAWKLLYAVSPAAGEESHGKMLMNNKISPTLPYLQTEKGLEFEKRLWKETLEKIEAVSPGAVEKANLLNK